MLYKHFATQEEIDLEYNPRFRVSNTDEMLNYYVEDSQRIRDTYGHAEKLFFGPTLPEFIDYYQADAENPPLHVFIHGGYWHSCASQDFALVAEAFIKNKISVALVNYSLCPQVTLDEIVRQCRSSLAFLYKNEKGLNYDVERISISGHSAGGHLTGMVLATDWKGHYGLPETVISSACLLSGLTDLSPFPYSWLQPKLQLTWDHVQRNSPIFHPPTFPSPVLVAVGQEESDEFKDQSKRYVDVLQNQAIPARYLPLEGKNHFTVLEDFVGEGGPLFEAILENI